MGIRFECPRCRKHFSVKDEYAGKEAKCTCGAPIFIPCDSDKIKFHCKNCGRGISVSNTHAGKKGRCPACKNIVTVPLLGTLLTPKSQPAPAGPAVAAVPTGMINFSCLMCGRTVQANRNSAGNIVPGSWLDLLSLPFFFCFSLQKSEVIPLQPLSLFSVSSPAILYGILL